MNKARILVQGIVQGVGFRPNIYRLAKALELKGYVRNLGNIVEIIVEGYKKDIETFITDIRSKKPPLSKIDSLNIQWLEKTPGKEFKDFRIIKSSSNFSGSSVIPPDVATCDNCLSEIMRKEDRRYRYPFTACTDCGPRFTVIRSIPYDRERTSMDKFPLCPQCMEEYKNPEDRRYHAEATCCPICGPSVFLYQEEQIEDSNPIKTAVKLIEEGNILAVKGIGGTHLVAQTTIDEPLITLRERLGRLHQPFACMSPDIATIKSFAIVNLQEQETLLSRSRPIVVLNKSEDYYLSTYVSPSLHNLGVMLPYSALHQIIFNYSKEPALIMTSANMPGEPMLIDNQEIIGKLEGVADYFLLHNRQIVNRCDDSVVRYRGDDLAFIRRSRGYVPEPYDLSFLNSEKNILALGPEIDVTFSLLKKGQCFVSQHIGNTTKYDTFQYLQKAIDYMLSITKTTEIDMIACDLHPMFLTTKLAYELSEKFNCEVLPVQHHHAHAAVLSVDNKIDELICIAADGVGYGSDGTAWGGEILHFQGAEYERAASLIPLKMPGGDLATRYPGRMLMSMLVPFFSDADLTTLMKKDYLEYFPHGEREIELILQQMHRDFNVNETTSTGRVLDAISAALKICGERTYEGECAMKLESMAFHGFDNLDLTIDFSKMYGREVLDTPKLLFDVLKKKKSGENIRNIACSAQRALAQGMAQLAINCAEDRGVKYIGGSGGVFYNEAISMIIKRTVENSGFHFIQHHNSCAGDGSVSIGQAAVAARILS